MAQAPAVRIGTSIIGKSAEHLRGVVRKHLHQSGLTITSPVPAWEQVGWGDGVCVVGTCVGMEGKTYLQVLATSPQTEVAEKWCHKIRNDVLEDQSTPID
jgi:hypothetical protein